MAVTEALSALSTTPASNTPAGTDSIGTDLDDHLRDIKKNVRFASNHPVQAAKITAYTVVATDHNTLLQVNATASAVTVTMLAAATAGDGFRVGVKRLNTTNTVTVDGNSSETIDVSLTSALTAINQVEWYVCDGSKWHIESDYKVGGAGEFTTIELGAASDTTLARSSAGVITVEGDTVATVANNHTWTAAQRGQVTSLSSSATMTIDLAVSNNFAVTLAATTVIKNPTNDTAGQSGSIFITQDGSGSRLATWESDWDFAGGTAPTLTTTAGAVDRVDYVILDSSNIHAVATLAYS